MIELLSLYEVRNTKGADEKLSAAVLAKCKDKSCFVFGHNEETKQFEVFLLDDIDNIYDFEGLRTLEATKEMERIMEIINSTKGDIIGISIMHFSRNEEYYNRYLS